MRNVDLIRLVSLAAIWGASFLFMRILAPVLGVLWTTELRLAIAGIAMLAYMAATRQAMQLRAYWKQYLVLGILTSALPSALYSYAALALPVGYLAILNATTPLWGALIGAAILDESLTMRKFCGLALGIGGVAFLVRLGPAQFSPQFLLAAAACIGATLCYAIASAYTKKSSISIAPPMMATGSQFMAALVMLPVLPLTPVRSEITPFIVFIALALGLLCSAVAYFLYFRLIVDLGPVKALTVTFLIPLFALVWGAVFLHEAVNLNTLIGCGLVAWATWLVAFQKKVQAVRTA
jgi:drug/metabolite transporter (DMT)-like permease